MSHKWYEELGHIMNCSERIKEKDISGLLLYVLYLCLVLFIDLPRHNVTINV